MVCKLYETCVRAGIMCDHRYPHKKSRSCFNRDTCWLKSRYPECRKLNTASSWVEEKI
jgi:hypothetical protein